MTEKKTCRYCGEKFHPRKLWQHEQECKKDQKGAIITEKPKVFPKGCMVRTCNKCGAQTGVFILDGAKCRSCGSDL